MTPRTWKEIRRVAQAVALEEGEWGGFPIPVVGIPLRVAPGHRRFDDWEGAALPGEDHSPRPFVCSSSDLEDVRERNSWWSRRLGARVWIYEYADGRIEHVVERCGGHRWIAALFRCRTFLETLRVATEAWDIEPEAKAVATLAEKVSETQLLTYLTLGAFVEESRRSQARYVFRRGRPTVVLLPTETGNLSPSVALCLHPIAYYEGTFAGGMVPTDDVLAHLLLMRADEARFWRQANQHPIDRPEAAI